MEFSGSYRMQCVRVCVCACIWWRIFSRKKYSYQFKSLHRKINIFFRNYFSFFFHRVFIALLVHLWSIWYAQYVLRPFNYDFIPAWMVAGLCAAMIAWGGARRKFSIKPELRLLLFLQLRFLLHIFFTIETYGDRTIRHKILKIFTPWKRVNHSSLKTNATFV